MTMPDFINTTVKSNKSIIIKHHFEKLRCIYHCILKQNIQPKQISDISIKYVNIGEISITSNNNNLPCFDDINAFSLNFIDNAVFIIGLEDDLYYENTIT